MDEELRKELTELQREWEGGPFLVEILSGSLIVSSGGVPLAGKLQA